MRALRLVVGVMVCACSCQCAWAEGTTIRVGRTPTLAQLPIYVLEGEKLIEKHAKAAGLGDVVVSYVDVAGGAVLNDMLLSGNLEFATGGVPPFLILWSRALGSASEVKAIAAVGGSSSTLYTRNPQVKSIKDLGGGDKIAVAGVKSSQVAILLQMAAAQTFGDANYDKLDPLTVTMRDADAVAIMKSGKGELTGHFTYDPYRSAYEGDAGIRPILQSKDVLGSVGTVTVTYATTKYRASNPKILAAYYSALDEAATIIQRDPARAARIYKEFAKSTASDAELERLIRAPDSQYSVTPVAVSKFAAFMSKIGTIKNAPASWKDMFFPEAHGLPGS
ncbi:MAG: ABC transporter substrate-binding protein [Casimicrobiaceae bacterium]